MSDLPPDLARLDEILLNLPDNDVDPMILSEFDGYVAGLLVCPEFVTREEWLPWVLGTGDTARPDGFESDAARQEMIGLAQGHYDRVAAELMAGAGCFVPIYEIDERNGDVIWEVWIEGFAAALVLRLSSWERFDEHEDPRVPFAVAGLSAMIAVARGDSGFDRRTIRETRDVAPRLIPVFVDILYAAKTGRAIPEPPSPPEPARSSRVGRNEPCPCGSGRKYKKCCGAG